MSEVQKFRKKPVVIEAIQWTGANLEEISEWSGGKVWFGFPESESRAATQQGREPVSSLWVSILEGDLRATVCDWIIKGVHDEFYPCKPDIFEQTYESATLRDSKEVKVADDECHFHHDSCVVWRFDGDQMEREARFCPDCGTSLSPDDTKDER